MKLFSIALLIAFLLASCSEDLRPASMDGVKYVVYEEFVPDQVMEQNLYRLAGRSGVGRSECTSTAWMVC